MYVGHKVSRRSIETSTKAATEVRQIIEPPAKRNFGDGYSDAACRQFQGAVLQPALEQNTAKRAAMVLEHFMQIARGDMKVSRYLRWRKIWVRRIRIYVSNDHSAQFLTCCLSTRFDCTVGPTQCERHQINEATGHS